MTIIAILAFIFGKTKISKKALLILLTVTSISSACIYESETEIRYDRSNLLQKYKEINKWLELGSDDYIDVTIQLRTYKDGTTGVDNIVITAGVTARKVIVKHKSTIQNGITTYWEDLCSIEFIDEYGITDHTRTVHYDMPHAIYKKLCRE